jgi:Lon protease-like protein
MLKSDHWQKLSAVEFSFMVNGLFGIPAELKQDLLEMTDTQQRLDFILDMLNSIQSSFDG